jgi:hypothetical protein
MIPFSSALTNFSGGKLGDYYYLTLEVQRWSSDRSIIQRQILCKAVVPRNRQDLQ